MASLASNELLQNAAVGNIAATILVSLAILAIARCATAFVNASGYRQFYKQHSDFYKISPSFKTRTLYNRLPVPWASETTYYLLDHAPMRKLFSRSPKLDAFGLAYRLHDKVWGVPPALNSTTLRTASSQIHRELSAKKLGPVTKSFEEIITKDILDLQEAIGEDGRLVPLHTTIYRIAYKGNLTAIFGPDLPVDGTRIPLQTFANNLRMLNTTPSLPLLPTEWWNRIIPSASRGARARDQVTNALIKWQKEGGLETCSETWRSVMKIVIDEKADSVHANRWVNMVLFGFQGNTGEQPGWTLLHLLQSPKLWAAVRAEVDALPPGSLVDVDFKRATPLLHAALHETLRLCTAVFAGRTVTQPTQIAGCDTVFPKNSLVRIMSRASAFDSSIWGAEPDCWKGDRFLLNDALFKELMVFGGGVSACPGRHFAMAELQLLLAHLIRSFDFDVSSLCMHTKLQPDAKDLEMGKPIKNPEYTCQIIDTDGSRITATYPGVADIENCMENVSGSLFPLQEATCFMKPRKF